MLGNSLKIGQLLAPSKEIMKDDTAWTESFVDTAWTESFAQKCEISNKSYVVEMQWLKCHRKIA